MNGFLAALTVITALGCGLNAGIFFAFSSFVMKALARLQPAQGIVACWPAAPSTSSARSG